MNLQELKQKKASLVKQARSYLDEVEKRGGGMSAEDTNKIDAVMAEINTITDLINRDENLREIEKTQLETRETPERPEPPRGTDEEIGEKRDLFYRDADKAQRLFRGFLSGSVSPGTLSAEMRPEARSLQMDSDIYGGYITAPQQFVNSLLKEKDNLVFMRRLAKVYSAVNAESLGQPSLDNDPADPTWTSELLIGSEDTTMTLGKRELRPHPLAQFIKVSEKLMRSALQSPEAIVRDRLAYKMSTVEENAFLNGSGAMQPLGVFTASSDGISTSRDVSTGNQPTEIRTDGLIECKMSLKQQYRQNCAWIFHRDAIKQLMKLKDGNGNYIWSAGITNNQPDRLLGYPIYESEYAPNTFTTGLYVGILGDFSYYYIADALNMRIQKLMELYAATNQIGFISRSETDGMPVLQNAFARVKLG